MYNPELLRRLQRPLALCSNHGLFPASTSTPSDVQPPWVTDRLMPTTSLFSYKWRGCLKDSWSYKSTQFWPHVSLQQSLRILVSAQSAKGLCDLSRLPAFRNELTKKLGLPPPRKTTLLTRHAEASWISAVTAPFWRRPVYTSWQQIQWSAGQHETRTHCKLT